MSKDPDSSATASGPELVIGLVGAVGIDFELVIGALKQTLGTVGYVCPEIRISQLLRSFQVWDGKPPADALPEDERIERFMNAGDRLRAETRRGEALAIAAVAEIRESHRKTPDEGLGGNAYLLRSLKHPAEVRALQSIYGPGFILVGTYLPEEKQLINLCKRIEHTSKGKSKEYCKQRAKVLLERDSGDPDDELGQNVRETFAMSDLFVDATDEKKVRSEIVRFVEQLFRHPYYTPTIDEYMMFHAYAAATRSASMSRQVGAAISTNDGRILSLGTNEVPKPLGGYYWEGDPEDDRDFRLGEDSNKIEQEKMLAELFDHLRGLGWLSSKANKANAREMLKRTRFGDLIEFHRVVHAETAAIIEAARGGVAIQGSYLYCTTFPCHNCARHIIAAGVSRVIYIEPYVKSKAPDFYRKGFTDDRKKGSRVLMSPFVGVGPRLYRAMFSMVTGEGDKIRRMDSAGKAIDPEKRRKSLRWRTLSNSQFDLEDGYIDTLAEDFRRLRAKGG